MKYIFSLFTIFWSMLAWGQEGFDPSNPQEPGQMYYLTVNATPSEAGSTSPSGKNQYALGQSIRINAYPNNGYHFVAWNRGNAVISENAAFSYTIPDLDTELIAVFEKDGFNPGNPDEPSQNPLQHKLFLEASPVEGGSFNINSGTLFKEGESVNLYTWLNGGYEFEGWKQGDVIVSRENSYSFDMGTEDITLTGLFRFNPLNPANPGANSWNEKTGELIIDDFTPGRIMDAVDNAIGGDGNRNKVSTMIVSGKMDPSDFGIARYLSNCTLLDLSRTGGYVKVPDWASNNSNLASVVLPACVENIGNGAFYECKNLADVSCYAITPPVLGSNVFYNISEGAVIHVLSSAISFYTEADGWKDFTILPMSEEVRALEVNLPAESNDGRYKNMTLELVNVQNGQKQKYVISDRVTYTFNGLLKNSSYSVYVKNQLGVVLGKLEDVEVKDENVSVTFDTLLSPQAVTLKVLTPEGEDVTSSIQNTWLTTDNVYLQQGASLYGLVTGMEIKYRIVLPQSIGMQYVLPAESTFVIGDKDNAVSYTLVPIREVTISGLIKDLVSGNPLFGAAVSVSQMLNGKYSKAFMAKTDAKGIFTMKVYDDISTITVSATDYISHTLEKQNFDDATDIGEIKLKSITGATINTILTFTPSAVEGEAVETQNWYTDYANVSYSIFNETQNRPVPEFSVQYPSIVLLEEASEGDRLRITATSKNNAFVSVTATAEIDALNRGEAVFPIIELGGIKATFTSTDNKTVVGILYDGKGQLIKKYDYGNAVLDIDNLPDGDYTLVSMANSSLFNSIFNLSQLAVSGLVEGSDYIKNSVTVKSGVIVTITNDLIPVLDESKLYYTGGNTLFSVNKPSVVAGNYLTLKGKVDFKNIYSSKVSGTKMIVDLPESCSFVENSVMVGSKISGYTLDGNRLTVPLDNYGDQVRFCIIPTLGGDYSPNAFVEFTLEDKEVLQPIGAANFTVKDLTITVPRTVAKTSVPVNGTAIGNSDIEIYDNGTLIGQTTSLANGVWATTCELNEPYNLSTHSIYAKVKTKQGLELQSETQECLYDMNAIQVSKVIMYHDNPEMHNTYEVVFDFLNPTSEAQKYTYYIYNKQFTFTIDFTNNDPSVVSDVILYVKTGKGNWIPLDAFFDRGKQLWVANGEFGEMYDGDIPVNVNVDFVYKREALLDSRIVSDNEQVIEDGIKNYAIITDSINNIYIEIEKLDISDDEYTMNLASLVQKMIRISNGNFVIDDGVKTVFDKETLMKYLLEVDALISGAEKQNNDFDTGLKDVLYYDTSEISNFYLSRATCDELLEADLDLSIYTQCTSADGHFIYYMINDNVFEYIDFVADTHLKLIDNTISDLQLDSIMNISDQDKGGIKDLYEWKKKIDDFVRQISLKKYPLDDLIKNMLNHIYTLEKEESCLNGIIGMKDYYLMEGMGEEFNSACESFAKVGKELSKARAALNVLKFAKNAIPIVNAIQLIEAMSRDLNICIELYYSVPDPCENDQERADEIKRNIIATGVGIGSYATLQASLISSEIAALIPAIAASAATMGTSLWVEAGIIAAQITSGWVYERNIPKIFANIRTDIKDLKCNKKTNPDSGKDNGKGQSSGSSDADPSIDPSGYVYEAVSSNRLQGVTATCYYKEMVEDMYGDLHEETVLWDAAEYAQENPLFTDEMGMYRWDVPQGLWQVKFDKEGYQTTYSEWLPVPPPQLEVNIPMAQSVQPTVKNARAYEDGIEVEFDKYMLPDALNADNIFVTKNTEIISGTVKLMNEEYAYEDNADKYASKVRFIPSIPFLTTDEITLTVSRKVKSYAGIQMESDYVQAFDIEKEVKSIVADSLIRVAYNGTKQVTVSALPYDAAIGKKLVARSSSSMITSITEEAVLDENGQAALTLTGELPGTSVITYSIEDADVQGTSVINVVDGELLQTATPVASRVSGTAVYRNTPVVLTCETEGAVIHYTTDGSCPCDEKGTRQVYIDPIVITEDVTIKAIAVAKDREESEIATFTFTIKTTSLELDLKKGWNWMSHTLETDVPAADISKNAIRIVGQTSELVNDPVSGLVGNLTSLSPMETYKIELTENTTHTLNGYEFNAGTTPVALHIGWNWIGYPVSQTMTVGEAFANAEPEVLDYIFGREGFAQFINGQWLGTLQVMKPGNGYLYHSQSEKSFIYNTSIISKAKSLYGKRMKNTSSWAVDKYAYPNMMCMIADIYKEDEKLDAGRYSIGAFCGTECRGISQYVDGKQMMTIFGSGDEIIDFRIMDHENEKVYAVQRSEKFAEVLLGNLLEPYSLQMGDEYTGIKEAESNLRIYPVVVSDRLYVSAGNKAVDRVSLTNIYGNIVLMQTHVEGSSGLKVNALPDGVYIVTVVQDGETFYKKIVKVARK